MTASNGGSEPRIWVEREYKNPLPVLDALNGEQLAAVRWAFKRWVEVAQREGYAPITEWRNFANEVDHSALLLRLLLGKDALEERPPTQHSYPVYPD